MLKNVIRGLFAICSIAPLAVWPEAVAAEGALAVGTTGNIKKDGYSIGISVNKETSEIARAGALDWCRTHGSPTTRSFCKIITTFHGQCAAEAYDPKPGTPGAGWAVVPDQETAKKVAMSNCDATAGRNRRRFCQIANVLCDAAP